MSSPAEKFLKHVANVIAERSTQYGDAATNMAAIAARWSATLGREITPAQVVLCLLDLKLARLAHDPTHEDSAVDVCGYAALLRELIHTSNTEGRLTMAPGRKRKPGKRYPCGKLTKQQLEMDAMSTVIDARRRHFGVTAKQAKDERLGTALGRLAFRELISETQYQAGVAFAQLYRDHHATVGLPSPSPRSAAGLLINEGIFGASPGEPALEVIEKVKRRFAHATSVLDACDREQRMSAGKRPTLLIYRVICTDQDAMNWPEEDLGNLRVALNAFVRFFRL